MTVADGTINEDDAGLGDGADPHSGVDLALFNEETYCVKQSRNVVPLFVHFYSNSYLLSC